MATFVVFIKGKIKTTETINYNGNIVLNRPFTTDQSFYLHLLTKQSKFM